MLNSDVLMQAEKWARLVGLWNRLICYSLQNVSVWWILSGPGSCLDRNPIKDWAMERLAQQPRLLWPATCFSVALISHSFHFFLSIIVISRLQWSLSSCCGVGCAQWCQLIAVACSFGNWRVTEWDLLSKHFGLLILFASTHYILGM